MYSILVSCQMINIFSVHFSVACVLIFLSTFIPKGAFAFNPKSIGTVSSSRSSTASETSEDDTKASQEGDGIASQKAFDRA